MKKHLLFFAAVCTLLLPQVLRAQTSGQPQPKGAQAFKQVSGAVKLVVLSNDNGMDSTLFDPAGHIMHEHATLSQTQSGASSVWTFRMPAGEKVYTYDADGRLSAFTDTDGKRYHDFVYDGEGRLLSYLIGDNLKHAFTYAEGNLERMTVYEAGADGTFAARPDQFYLDDATIFDENGNWTKTDYWGPEVSIREITYYDEWEL